MEYIIPHFSALFMTMFFVGNGLFLAAFIYFGAFVAFLFHSAMCWLGKFFGMRELPPPYEFFLVRNAGGYMWFSITVWLMALPVLAQRPDLIGRLGLLVVLAVPLIWAVLFLVAGLSRMETGNRERVHLKEMYESDRFVRLVWRTQLTFAVLTFIGIMLPALHPDFLVKLISFHH
jgi:hypothetical protein